MTHLQPYSLVQFSRYLSMYYSLYSEGIQSGISQRVLEDVCELNDVYKGCERFKVYENECLRMGYGYIPAGTVILDEVNNSRK